MSETREFKIHRNLLAHVVRDQAGTLWKALNEGCQNAVDSGSTGIDITVTEKQVVMVDDGRGFQDAREVDDFFATFGTPHEQGDAVFGRFRMGRGQLFSFGRNVWESNSFRFDVDVQHKGLAFEFTDGLPAVKGCTITIDLYDPLLPSNIFELERDLTRAVRYYPIPVTLNGKQISKHPKDERWDLETNDAYIKFRDTGGVLVYHLGAFICEMSSYQFGRAGTVLSKKQLDVNFARNAIKDSCVAWRRIRQHFHDEATRENLKRPKLDDAARANLIEQFVTGELRLDKISRLKVLRDANGTLLSISQLPGRGSTRIAIGPEGDSVADKLMQSRQATVLALETLELFQCSDATEFVELLKTHSEGASHKLALFLNRLEPSDFDQLRDQYKCEFLIIPESAYTPLEKAWIKALSATFQSGHNVPMWRGDQKRSRRFLLGASDVAQGWTNGVDTIVINRDYLKEYRVAQRGLHACVAIAQLVCHELCHDENDAGSHLHNDEFFHQYHDQSEALAHWANDLFTHLTTQLVRGKESATRETRRVKDRLAKVRQSIEAIEKETQFRQQLDKEIEQAERELDDKQND